MPAQDGGLRACGTNPPYKNRPKSARICQPHQEQNHIWLKITHRRIHYCCHRDQRPLGCAYSIAPTQNLADGIFLGLALFHLLPEAYFKLGGGEFVILKLALLCLLGYGILFFSTRFEHRHSAWFLLAMLSLHATITGSVLGIANTFSEFFLMTFAILAHKGFETFALMTGLSRYWQDKTRLQLALCVFALMTPIGILLGGVLQYHLASSHQSVWLSYLNAVAAGTLLFIGISHSHGHQHKALKKYQERLFTLSGMGLMALLALWV